MSFHRVRPENEARAVYRKACPRHVVTFELDIDEDEKRQLAALNERVRKAGNSVAGPLKRRIGQMKRTRKYRKLQKNYSWHVEHLKGLEQGSGRWKTLDAERAAIAKEMSAMQHEYGVTWGNARLDMAAAAKEYGIPSVFALTRGEDIWKGVEKVLFSDGKNIHLQQRGDLPVMRAKQAERIIIPKARDGRLVFSMDGHPAMPVKLPEDDYFLQDEHDAIVSYIMHPEEETFAVRQFAETGELTPVFRPCYCQVKVRTIRGRLRVYMEVCIAALPCRKRDRSGNPRHDFSKKGRVGCDVGTQSVASVSDVAVHLQNLGERNEGSLKDNAHKRAYILRKADQSRRGMNPV